MQDQELERAVCAVICRSDGIRAREIAKQLSLDHQTVNSLLYSSPLMRELCWQDRDYRWHGLVRQKRPHIGLQEFSGSAVDALIVDVNILWKGGLRPVDRQK